MPHPGHSRSRPLCCSPFLTVDRSNLDSRAETSDGKLSSRCRVIALTVSSRLRYRLLKQGLPPAWDACHPRQIKSAEPQVPAI